MYVAAAQLRKVATQKVLSGEFSHKVHFRKQTRGILNLAAGYVRTTHTATPPDITPGHIAEMSTGERLDSTFFIIFAELGRFTKRAEECVTVKDRLFYWFKHASELKDAPMWPEEPELSALMTATQIAAFPPEKKETYIKDIMNERDIKYQQNICYKRGLEQGREEGREEGARETAIKTAGSLLQNGVSVDIVASCTGLSLEEVNALRG